MIEQINVKEVNIKLNGKRYMIPENISVSGLLLKLEVKTKWIAVQINDKIIEKSDFEKVIVDVNNEVEIIQPMGGG